MYTFSYMIKINKNCDDLSDMLAHEIADLLNDVVLADTSASSP